ncbi:MAG: leishmanolysin-related zinc metalloendopeptidase [Microthrixaceae bacterium]
MHSQRAARRSLVAIVAATTAVAAACIPQPDPGPATTTPISDTPTPPTITAFDAAGGIGSAPSVVALKWTIGDANGDPLTCRLDTNGDGTPEHVIDPCPTSASRNVSIADPGIAIAVLEVDDGTFAPVSRTLLLDVPAGPSESFDIELRGIDDLAPEPAAAFSAARQRWEQVIVRGIADRPLTERPACLPAEVADLPALVDDVIIDVTVVWIDGPGGVLGQAGPTCVNTVNGLAIHGVMEFDEADVATLLAEDSFDLVVLHEMAHVLGFGTLWDLTSIGNPRNLVAGAGTAGTRYVGARGVAENSTLGRSGDVPLETTGGAGTRDSHWRESIFDDEIMTGYLNSGTNPLSRLTIGSLADLGYHVDLGAADAYSLPGASLRRGDSAPSASGDIVLRPPMGGV